MDDCDLLSETLPNLSSLTSAMRQYRRVNRLIPWVWVFAVAATAAAIGGFAIVIGRDFTLYISESLLTLSTAFFGCLFGSPLWIAQRRHRKAFSRLFSSSDVCMTPLLFEFLLETCGSDSSAHDKREFEKFHVQTRTALLRLLPGLRQEHASLFDNSSRILWRRLLHRVPSCIKDTELVIQVLKALEVLGDEEDFQVVAMIADGRSARSWPLKQAAFDCVVAIRERMKQQQDHASLLRPAANGDLLGQTLLRPHNNRAASCPEQLLRAHSSPP